MADLRRRADAAAGRLAATDRGCCAGDTACGAAGARRRAARCSGRSAARRGPERAASRVRPARGLSGGDAPAASLPLQAGGRTALRPGARPLPLAELPAGVTPPAPSPAASELEKAAVRRRWRARGIARARPATTPYGRAARRGAECGGRRRSPPARGRAASDRRQGVRRPRRGRHGQGRPPRDRGGLRLDRALQALHDGHDGPVAGPQSAARRRPPDGAGDRPDLGEVGRPRRGRRGRRCRWASSPAARSSRPSAPRSTAATASSARRDVGGRLAPRLRLRRPAGRGARRPRERRADRRLDARQAARQRPRGRRVPRPPVSRTGCRTSSPGASATA